MESIDDLVERLVLGKKLAEQRVAQLEAEVASLKEQLQQQVAVPTEG